jgi:hypothetical protein
MKKLTIILMALVTSLSGLRAQNQPTSSTEKPTNSIGIYWGTGNLKKQDLIFTPFVHQSWSPVNVMLNYERSGKLEQRASIRYGHYGAQTGDPFSYIIDGETYSKYGHSFNLVDLNYSLGVKLVENEQWKFILGGRIRARFQISDYDFGSAGSFGYYIPMGLDAWVNLKYDPGSKHRFEANLNLPLFSGVARSPYMGQDDGYMERISVHGDLKIFFEHVKTAEIQSWGTSQIVDLDLRYHYALNDRWELGAGYMFSMNLHSTPARLTSYEHLFLIGTTINL